MGEINAQEIKPIQNPNRRNYLKISLPLAGMVLLLGAVYLTVNNALQQQQDNRSQAALGTNMIANSGFESGSGSWQFNKRSGSGVYTITTSTKSEGLSSAQITVASSGTAPQEIELAQYGKAITAGQTYTVSVWAKAATSHAMDIVIQDSASPFREYLRRTANLTSTWQQFTYTFVASESKPNVFVGLQVGRSTGVVYVDNVQFSTGSPSAPTVIPTATRAPSQVPTATRVPTQAPSATTVPTATKAPTPTLATNNIIMTINKSSYTAGENMTVYWQNIPGATPRDWIGLYTPTAANGSEIGWVYVNCTQTATVAVASGQCTFPIPATAPAGTLELRMHPNDGNTVLKKSPLFNLVGVTPGLTLVPTATIPPTVFPTLTKVPTAGPTLTKVPTMTTAPSATGAPTNPPVATNTPVPGSTLVGVNLMLHGLGKGGDAVNAGGTGNMSPLRPQRTVTVDIYDVQNQLVLSKQGTVTFNATLGNFSGNVDLGTQFNTGIYTVKIKTDQYLRGLVAGIQTISKGQTTAMSSLTLVSGDVNNDNAINIVDYNIIVGCYSDLLPPVSCNDLNEIRADLNDDGNVNQFDYNLFIRELTNLGGQ
jgi:hypothetical protein